MPNSTGCVSTEVVQGGIARRSGQSGYHPRRSGRLTVCTGGTLGAAEVINNIVDLPEKVKTWALAPEGVSRSAANGFMKQALGTPFCRRACPARSRRIGRGLFSFTELRSSRCTRDPTVPLVCGGTRVAGQNLGIDIAQDHLRRTAIVPR